MLCSTIVSNIFAELWTDHLYPYLRKCKSRLNKEEMLHILTDAKDFTFYRFGSVVTNSADNLIISKVSGVADVGYVSNYTLLTSYSNLLINGIISSLTPGLGNLTSLVHDRDRLEEMFFKVFFISAWIYGFFSVGIALCSNTLIGLWLGKEYCVSLWIVIAIILDYYYRGIQYVTETYRTLFGLFRKGKYAPLLGAGLNVVMSILLYRVIGLPGVFIATPVSRFITTGLVDPILIFREVFGKWDRSHIICIWLSMLLLIYW